MNLLIVRSFGPETDESVDRNRLSIRAYLEGIDVDFLALNAAAATRPGNWPIG